MKPETIAIHGGFKGDPATHAVAVPLYQTTSYYFDDTQHGADLFDLKVEGNIYSRIMNPTCAVLEERVAQLEGGIGSLAMASGMAAITATLQTLARAGENIVSVNQLYGGTYNFFAHTLPTMGIDVRFAPGDDLAALEAHIDDQTRLIFCESIGNPAGNIVDIEGLAAVAHRHGLPLVVDNTVATPVLCRPFDFGADIVVHSLTKYMGGHGTTIGGIIVDSGKFDWKDNPRFRQFNEPDPSYHGVVYSEALGEAAFIGRARVVPLRNMGAALSPFNAFLIMQGIETLSLRMERHTENALAVAGFLESHPHVSWVNYAGLNGDRHHELAQKYMNGRPAGILTFGINGGRPAGA
ncbi:MAG: aminotransferase class I/II-fold pyridoxal phosphate-dependent enzyme, partial [Gammaproteobacteria bacterium]|nr:aminotransferase class I/II-fold pyridoxal phosphate-dependent enzyme [Gammaproteobacteria bacterium]